MLRLILLFSCFVSLTCLSQNLIDLNDILKDSSKYSLEKMIVYHNNGTIAKKQTIMKCPCNGYKISQPIGEVINYFKDGQMKSISKIKIGEGDTTITYLKDGSVWMIRYSIPTYYIEKGVIDADELPYVSRQPNNEMIKYELLQYYEKNGSKYFEKERTINGVNYKKIFSNGKIKKTTLYKNGKKEKVINHIMK